MYNDIFAQKIKHIDKNEFIQKYSKHIMLNTKRMSITYKWANILWQVTYACGNFTSLQNLVLSKKSEKRKGKDQCMICVMHIAFASSQRVEDGMVLKVQQLPKIIDHSHIWVIFKIRQQLPKIIDHLHIWVIFNIRQF